MGQRPHCDGSRLRRKLAQDPHHGFPGCLSLTFAAIAEAELIAAAPDEAVAGGLYDIDLYGLEFGICSQRHTHTGAHAYATARSPGAAAKPMERPLSFGLSVVRKAKETLKSADSVTSINCLLFSVSTIA